MRFLALALSGLLLRLAQARRQQYEDLAPDDLRHDARPVPDEPDESPWNGTSMAVLAMLQGTARCWRPSLNRSTYQDPAVHATLTAALTAELERLAPPGVPLELHPITIEGPLKMFGRFGPYLPYHHAVGLVDKKSPNLDRCLDFDYGADTRGADDAAGCGFFGASFRPLQAAVECATSRLKEDPLAVLWDKISNRTSSGAPLDPDAEAAGLSSWARKEQLSGGLPGLEERFTTPQILSLAFEAFKHCQHKLHCARMDFYIRAVELLKWLSLQNWDGIGPSAARAQVIEALLGTNSTPQAAYWHDPADRMPALLDSTMDRVATECLHLGSESGPVDRAALVSERPALLKESLHCLPLMWDITQVLGPPTMGLFPMEWQPPAEVVDKAYGQIHPLCGRVAVSALAQFSKSQYPAGLELLKLTSQTHQTDKYCLNPMKAQCKNFKQCWAKMFEQHVASLSARCAVHAPHPEVDSEEEASRQERLDSELGEGDVACCCRATDGSDGGCDLERRPGAGVFGLRFFRLAVGQCCRLERAGEGCSRDDPRYSSAPVSSCSPDAVRM